MVSFRARRAVGLLLVLVGSLGANPCDTCSGCYDLAISYCMGGTTAAGCVGNLGAYKWCGTNPCDWCSGCYKYDRTCDTTISGQANCFSSGPVSHGSMWCGADEGTCTGCPGCYKQSDTAGPVCDTNSFSTTGESACTANNHIDGVDNTWCGSASWPCYDSASGATCNNCYS